MASYAYDLRPLETVLSRYFSCIYDQLLHLVATKKEWYLYKHAKRFRVRKKIKNRLAKRISIMAQVADQTRGQAAE